jgi:tripartite ATP-independent transporter DctP family solute receptor
MLSATFVFGAGKQEAAPAAPGKPVELKIYTFMSGTSLAGKSIAKMAQDAEKMSGGRLKFSVFNSGALGNDREGLESCRMGTLDIYLTGTGIYSSFYPYTKMFDLPYLFETSKQAFDIINGPIGDEVFKEMTKYNLVHLSTGDSGMRNISTTNKQINTVEDIKGLKVRVPEIDTYVDTWKSWGAVVTPMPLAELYMALKTGVVDAQDNAPYHTYASKVYEAQNYYSMINYMWMGLTTVMNLQKYNSLPDDLKKVLKDAAKEMALYSVNSVDGENKAAFEEFKKRGMQINMNPDIASFKRNMPEFYKKYEKEPWFKKDIVEKIRGK